MGVSAARAISGQELCHQRLAVGGSIGALEPFRVPASPRAERDPEPCPISRTRRSKHSGAFDLTLEALLLTPGHARERRAAPLSSASANLRELYWTPAQLIAHHTSNGCNLQPGDLLASGTVSGAEPMTALGVCLSSRAAAKQPIQLPNGEKRRAASRMATRSFCAATAARGLPLVSLGECRGVVAARV